MINRVILFSLRQRTLVMAVAVLVTAYGVSLILRMPVDVLPDLNRPTVTIFVEAGGLAPEEIESFVALPVEQSIFGAPGVVRVRSVASIGLALIFVEFDWKSNILTDRQIVAERLQLATERLPAGVTPVLGPITSIMGNIMLVGLQSKTGETSPMDLRDLADWVVRYRLLGIQGVAQVTVIGGDRREYQVLVSPEKLKAHAVSLTELEDAVARSSQSTTGGFVQAQSHELVIRNLGRTASLTDIENTVVRLGSGPVLVRDVARVTQGATVKRGDGSVNAKPAVILSIQKQPGANTLVLTEQIRAALADLRASLPPDVEVQANLFSQADFIERAIANVEDALRDGAILVAIILFVFLLNFRTTFITLTAIPLSFVLTALVFKFMGLSVNTMTLGGLAVAIGELTDDAIVGVENVFRRLRENRRRPEPHPALQVVYDASREIRNSIVFATIIVVLVFLPLFSMGGIEGRIFTPLGIAYVVSITASLLVSLTVTPVLCLFLLPKARAMERPGDSPFVALLKRVDTRLLQFSLRRPVWVMVAASALVLGAIAIVPFLGRSFLPVFNEGTATVNVISPPGTSLPESNRIGTVAEQLLMQIPEVIAVTRRTGRAELDDHAEGVHYTEIEVNFRPSKRSREELFRDIRERLTQIPGVLVAVGQPIQHRVDHLLSGTQAQIVVKLFGNELDVLRATAENINAAMRSVPGVVDLQTEQQVLIPQVSISVNRKAAQKFGLSPGALVEQLETAFNGHIVGTILDRQRTYDLLVRFDDPYRNSVPVLGAALIDTPSGSRIPVFAVADIAETTGPNQILHENTLRRIVVSCNTAGRDLSSVVSDIRNRVATQVKLPVGYFVTYEGQFQAQQEATRLIALLSLVSLAAIFFVLFTHFGSINLALQVMLSIPLALIGSVAGILLTGGVLSVASLIGLIALTGIASRNGIMMTSHYLHLMKHEGETFDDAMIIRGSLERLVPVLMTALVAGLALLPLSLAAGQPGKEILHPMAIVILTGLLTSTLFDQAVRPAVFKKFGRKAAEQHVRTHETE